MLAGNLFDMGAHATASEYTASGGATRSQERDQWLSRVPPRPWFRDDVEPFASHVSLQPPSHTVIFADNAGADVLLGVLPLAMLLARAGGHVTIGANARPSLNDITAPELAALIDEIRRRRVIEAPELSRVSVASTGSGAPLIDLLRVDPAFAQTSSTAQLVVLVGMGRALESNWNAAFRVNVLRVAMIKDQQVARGLGARLFDAVVRWG